MTQIVAKAKIHIWSLMRPYHLMELCCGSAALTLHQLGAKKSVLPYHGSKWRLRRPLAAILMEYGYGGPPYSVQLNDIGPWGQVWDCLVDSQRLELVIQMLKLITVYPPRIIYEELQHKNHAVYPDRFAAEFLFLQRISVNGKAVGTKDGRWKSPGYNKNSAEGCAKTDKFGGVRPMVPYLIEVLEELRDLEWPDVSVSRQNALSVGLDREDRKNIVVYIDPDYASSTGYPNGSFPREDVVTTALHWADRDALVLVSEAEPVSELVGLGWTARQLEAKKGHTSPFKGKKSEWVTVSPKD